MDRAPVIAIDGPAGAGKSELSRRVARVLGYLCVDTGAVFRAIAYCGSRHSVEPQDAAALGALAALLFDRGELSVELSPTGTRIRFGVEDISDVIRSEAHARAAALVAQHGSVRAVVDAWLNRLVAQGGLVVEGRNTGAALGNLIDLKFFLFADLAVRAQRRLAELKRRGIHAELAEVLESMQGRDMADRTRALAPLQAAADAVQIDTSVLTLSEVVRSVLSHVWQKFPRLARLQHEADAELHSREYGTLRLLAGNTKGIMQTAKADLKILSIAVGQQTSQHRHLIAESLFHLLSGSVWAETPLQRFLAGPGDTFIVPPGVVHQLRNAGEVPAEVLEIESPPHDRADKLLAFAAPPDGNVQQTSGRFWQAQNLTRVRVKICGISHIDSAYMCHELDVDAIGIHAVGADRCARIKSQARWLAAFAALPMSPSIFLLTDATDPDELILLATQSACDTVQLQGALPADAVRGVAARLRSRGWRVVKSVGAAQPAVDVAAYCRAVAPFVDAVLLDSSWAGGSGVTAPPDLVRSVLEAIPEQRFILAGGLNHGNVGEAITRFGPMAVDVESGIEVHLPAADGGRRISVRTARRIEEFVAAVRRPPTGS